MDQLTTFARLRILEGELPVAPTLRPDGTRSAGQSCCLCDQAIEPGSPLIMIRWLNLDQEQNVATLHPLCHAVWLGFVSDTRRAGRDLIC
jgi:hypothetical protein